MSSKCVHTKKIRQSGGGGTATPLIPAEAGEFEFQVSQDYTEKTRLKTEPPKPTSKDNEFFTVEYIPRKRIMFLRLFLHDVTS